MTRKEELLIIMEDIASKIQGVATLRRPVYSISSMNDEPKAFIKKCEDLIIQYRIYEKELNSLTDETPKS